MELPEHKTVVFDVLEKVVGHHHVKRIVLKRNVVAIKVVVRPRAVQIGSDVLEVVLFFELVR